LAKSLRHLRYRRLTLDPRAHKEGIPLRVPKHPLIDQVVETLPDVGRGELQKAPIAFTLYAFIEKKLQDIEAATSVLVPHLQKHIAHRVLHAHHVVSQLHEIVRGCQALLQKVLLVEPLDDNALLVIEVLHQLTRLPPHQHRHLLDI